MAVVAKIARLWSWFWSSEDLGPPPGPARSGAPEHSRRVEPMPSPARSASLRSVFLSRDELPSLPAAASRRPSFLSWLLSREILPASSAETPGRANPSRSER